MDDKLFKEKALLLKTELAKQLYKRLSTMDDDLVKMIKEYCVVSGGVFTSILQGTDINDIDLWCKDKVGLSVLPERLKLVYNGSEQPMIEAKYMDQFVAGKIVTSNAITLDNKLQFITLAKFEDAKKSFDYLHCTPSYDIKSDLLFISKKQMSCILNKTLIINNPYTVTERRTKKFTDKGWL